jgi:AcrR family transcriptional regulator
MTQPLSTTSAHVEPQQERSVESTQHIVSCATELFVERGYTATTFAMIAERTGYSRGIVTARFGNKENLAFAVVRQATAQWDEMFARHQSSGTGLDDLLAFVRLSQSGIVADPTSRLVLERLYSESLSPLSPLHVRFQQSVIDLGKRLASYIEKGVEDGSIRQSVNINATAQLLIAQLRGIGYQWFLFPELVDTNIYHEALLEQLLRSLTPP